jgi:adenosylhomocysteine nucleosidase
MIRALYLVALKKEWENPKLAADERIVYTGVGKVNAAISAMRAVHEFKPKLIVNFGSAASNKYPPLTILNCTGFVQRDADCAAINLPPYRLPGDAAPILKYGIDCGLYEKAICGTGDSFVDKLPDKDFKDYDCVDMEGYALAKTAMENDTPFLCVKIISDSGNNKDWETNIKTIGNMFDEIYKNIIPLCHTAV